MRGKINQYLVEDFKVALLRSLPHHFYYFLQRFNLSEVEFATISEKRNATRFNLCRTKIISVYRLRGSLTLNPLNCAWFR